MRNIAMITVLVAALALGLPCAAADPSGQPAASESPASSSGKERPAEIGWLAYEAGLAKAKESGKPVLVSFWAEWCGYCRKMKAETYTDPRVAAEVMANFVPVTVNTTKEPKLAAEYYVRGLPTIWFVGSDGTKITALPGYVDAPMFLKVLRYIATRSYEKMDFQAFLAAGS